MTSNGIIKTITLLAVAIFLLTACSIYDEYPHRRQYDVTLRVADSTGQILPDSVAWVTTLYAFKDGIYCGKYTKEEDGKIHLVFQDDDSLTFVAIAGQTPSEYDVKEPQIGDPIDDVWLQLHIDKDSITHTPSAIYYGSLLTTISEDDVTDQRVVTLHDMRAKARVYVRGLRTSYGIGNYQVVLKGLYSGLTYSGKSGGSAVSYNLLGKFVNQEDWLTSPVLTFPTDSEPVRLMLYKQDGSLILDTSVDENGKPLLIHKGDDIVFYVVVDNVAGISIKVIPFEDLDNSFIFE